MGEVSTEGALDAPPYRVREKKACTCGTLISTSTCSREQGTEEGGPRCWAKAVKRGSCSSTCTVINQMGMLHSSCAGSEVDNVRLC